MAPGAITGGGPVSRRFDPVEKDIGEIRWHAERGSVEANGHLIPRSADKRMLHLARRGLHRAFALRGRLGRRLGGVLGRMSRLASENPSGTTFRLGDLPRVLLTTD